MSIPPSTLTAVQRLLLDGEVPATSLECLPAGPRLGLWALSRDGGRAVGTRTLVRLWSALPDAKEAVAAVCACDEFVRPAWLGILAARLHEMGKRRDASELCKAIDQLGVASPAVRRRLADAALKPTGLGDLEMELFGVPAEQAVALPKLLRAVAVTAALVEGGQGKEAGSLSDVDPLDPAATWTQGRLLCLPDKDMTPPESVGSVLTGTWAELAETERQPGDDKARRGTMRWVLYRPWALLLAQVVFTQEAWAAERMEGGLALELDDAQLARFHEPGMVHVVVTTAAGEEVLCGSLGGLLLRVLDYLGVTLLAPAARSAMLDDRLGPLVHALLERKVWRYDARGASGRRPGYLIHEDFSDACYGRFGGNHFYRLGSRLTAAVRAASESWARERLDQARPAARNLEEATA